MQEAAVQMEPQAESTPPKAATPRRSTFWMCFWMGVLLADCKFYYWGGPDEMSWRELQTYAQSLGIVAHMDAVYALAVGIVGQALLWLTRSRPRLQKWSCTLLLAFCLLSVFYAVAAVRVFQQLRMPLTYTLIQLAGDARNMRSSVMVYFSPGVAAALLGLPLLYLTLVWASRRWLEFRRTWIARTGQVLALGLVAAYVIWAKSQINGPWGAKYDDRRISDSPHIVLAASYINAFLGDRPVMLNENYPDEFLNDFRTADQRGAGGGAPTPALKRGPKNVILVVLESVGTQQMSLYGSPFKTTPRLEEEARYALVFDNFYTHVQNTANSLVAITLGVYPMDPRAMWRERTVHSVDMPGTTPAAALKPHGYRSAFISAGDNQWKNQAQFLKNRGFDDVWDYRQSGCTLRDEFSWGVEDKCVVDMVLKWIEQDRSKPFFVMAWTQGTHHPYEPFPGQEEIEFNVDQKQWGNMWWDLGRYLNALSEMDRQMGRLFEELRKRGLAEDTVVMIVGDHGEGFGWPHPMSVGHSGNVYQEDVNVPFIVWNPTLFSGAGRSKTVAAHVDIGPTVLDVVNAPCPASWQGHSVFAPDRPSRAFFYGAMDNYMLGVRDENWKYVLNVTRGVDELYDLSADPREQANVASVQGERARDLRKRLGAWVDYQKRRESVLSGK